MPVHRHISKALTTSIVAAVIATLGVVSAPAPAGAQTAPGNQYYIAMGASLVTGVGSTGGADYVNDIGAFAQPLLPGLQVVNLGCGGETTTTMIDGGRCTKFTTGSQLGDAEAFLAAHPGQVPFMTIDIGGDDVLGCASGTTVNTTCFANGLANIEQNLPTILAGLRTAGGDVPIVALAYYDPYLSMWLDGATGQSAAHLSVKLVHQLNQVLTSIYESYGVVMANAYGKFRTTDFTGTGSWNGTTLPLNVANVCNWTLMCSSGGTNVHTNNTGYAVLAKAFEGKIRVAPSVAGTPPPATVGVPYSYQFELSGIPRAHASFAGTLPAGLRMSRRGLLHGTPTTAGTSPLTVTATNKVGSASEAVSVAVGG